MAASSSSRSENSIVSFHQPLAFRHYSFDYDIVFLLLLIFSHPNLRRNPLEWVSMNQSLLLIGRYLLALDAMQCFASTTDPHFIQSIDWFIRKRLWFDKLTPINQGNRNNFFSFEYNVESRDDINCIWANNISVSWQWSDLVIQANDVC